MARGRSPTPTRDRTGRRWRTTASPVAVGVASGSPTGVAAALGRVEARRLVSVSFVIGMVFSLLALLYSRPATRDNGDLIGRVIRHLGLVAYPLAGMTLLAASRETLPSWRAGTEELFTTTPTDTTTPTARPPRGHLGYCRGVGPHGRGAIVVLLGDGVGPLGSGWVAEALTGVVLVAGAGALGVLLARWLPHGIVAPLVLVAILLATLALNVARPFSNPVRSFAPWASPEPDLAVRLRSAYVVVTSRLSRRSRGSGSGGRYRPYRARSNRCWGAGGGDRAHRRRHLGAAPAHLRRERRSDRRGRSRIRPRIKPVHACRCPRMRLLRVHSLARRLNTAGCTGSSSAPGHPA